MNETGIQSWWHDGIKALKWLEEQREKTDKFFSPYAVAIGSKVDLATVNLAIDVENTKDMLEHQGKKVRFDDKFRIRASLKDLVEQGLMVEVSPGEFSMTKAGELYAQNLLMTDPEASEFFKRLAKANK
jgi:hypothetical protein